MKDFVYVSHNGNLTTEPIDVFKQWMAKHDYDPEHGKNTPTRNTPENTPAGTNPAGAAPSSGSSASPQPGAPPQYSGTARFGGIQPMGDGKPAGQQIFRQRALKKVLVLQGKPQESVGALTLQLKLATHAGAVVLDGSVVDGKLGADFFAGFALGDQTHDTELGRREIAGQRMARLRIGSIAALQQVRRNG